MRVSGLVIRLALAPVISVNVPPIQADDIAFPSLVTNGSFEEWGPSFPIGWRGEGWISADQADPFYGEYTVQLTNVMPWDGYLYQDFPYHDGSVLFGCAHWSAYISGDEIIVRYFDSEMNEISHREWESHSSDWGIILELLHPPEETSVIRVELVPMLDGIGILVTDHVFMIPVGLKRTL